MSVVEKSEQLALVRVFAAALLETPPTTDAECVDLVASLETLKSAACALQARLAADLIRSQSDANPDQRPEVTRRSVIAQVALARRESPHQAGRLVGMAEILVREMPFSLAALEAGAINEYRAMLLVRETACLSRRDRALVDAEVCGDREALDGVGTRELVSRVRAASYRLDPASVAARSARAEAGRHVTLRPAPECMTYLTALLPVAQGVACLAALRGAAARAAAGGDPRGRGQVMADTLVQRLTGQASADAVPVGVHLVMSDASLLTGSHEPAHLRGFGPIPASVARRLVGQAPEVLSWVRALYTARSGDSLVAMESRRRLFPRALATFIHLRDRTCRTPFCDAPIRHVDHVVPWSEGGETSATNAQGLCEACNHAKQAAGWRQVAEGSDDATHTVTTRTPTGRRYRSRAPSPTGQPRGFPMWVDYRYLDAAA